MGDRMRGRIIWFIIVVLFLTGAASGCGPAIAQGDNPLKKSSPTATVTPFPPTATRLPPTPTPSPLPTASPTEEVKPMYRIILVYDNYPYKSGLGTAWGFSAFITFQEENLLFDSGGSGSLLLSNLAALKIKPDEIHNVVLSHEHNDHTGGLQSLLNAGADPKLYIPPHFSAGFKNLFRNQAQLIEVDQGMGIIEGVYSLGEMSGPPPEQGLVIDTPQGLVIITGCAHPGVDRMVLEAKRQYQKEIYLVLGGFHLGSASDSRINQIIKVFQEAGVKYVAPCHCTGDRAIGMFRNAFGEDFIRVGVGAVISVES